MVLHNKFTSSQFVFYALIKQHIRGPGYQERPQNYKQKRKKENKIKKQTTVTKSYQAQKLSS